MPQEQHNNMMMWLLVGVGGYLLYEWWQGQSTTVPATVTPGTTSNPVVNTINSGNTAGPINPTSPAAPPPTPPSTPPPAPTTTTIRAMIAASGNPALINDPNFSIYMAGHGVGPDMVLSIPQVQALLTGYTPPPLPQQTGNVQGFTYTTKATYLQALINAVKAASGNSNAQTADEWNWFMVNRVGVNLAPALDDSQQASVGMTPGNSLDATTYYNALDKLGLISYPSGLTGLAAAARGMTRRVRHPLAQGRGF